MHWLNRPGYNVLLDFVESPQAHFSRSFGNDLLLNAIQQPLLTIDGLLLHLLFVDRVKVENALAV